MGSNPVTYIGSPGDDVSGVFIYASNEPKSVLARDLGDCRDNLRNSQSVFLKSQYTVELVGKGF